MGTIYTHFTDYPLKSLGLDHYQCNKLPKSLTNTQSNMPQGLSKHNTLYSKSPRTNGADQVVGVDASQTFNPITNYN